MKPSEQVARTKNIVRGFWGHYLSTFFLTLTNPMTILSFVALFSAIGLANTSHDFTRATFTVVGVFLGSSLWWLILSSGAGWLREKFHPVVFLWIGRLSAAIIIGFGVFGIVSSGAIA